MNENIKPCGMQSLIEKDRRYLWHPFSDTELLEITDFPIIERAEGIYLYEEGGHRLIDGFSSWWCCNLGHSHPSIVEAICSQASTLQHSALGGMSHPQAILLAEKLQTIAPKGLSRSFFASDGASAVEAALKIALQYWANIGRGDKKQFISLKNGYHGDTLGAMGVGFMPTFHTPFAGAIIESLQADAPSNEDVSIESIQRLIEENHATVAAVILEPLCQGACGMNIYPPSYLQKVRSLCSQYNILLIADEIAVAFGRTGTMFACSQSNITPDILCLGKAMTGGHLPMSATMVTEEVFDAFRNKASDEDKTFLHGHTFCGNPITAAAACAALDVYVRDNICLQAKEKGLFLQEAFLEFSHFPSVSRIRSLGMIAAFDLDLSKETIVTIVRFCRKEGLLIRPLGSVMYVCPPLISTKEELRLIVDILKDGLRYGVENFM